MSINIDQAKCIGCSMCVTSCPVDALTVDADFKSQVDRDICSDCLVCIDYCPMDAITEV